MKKQQDAGPKTNVGQSLLEPAGRALPPRLGRTARCRLRTRPCPGNSGGDARVEGTGRRFQRPHRNAGMTAAAAQRPPGKPGTPPGHGHVRATSEAPRALAGASQAEPRRRSIPICVYGPIIKWKLKVPHENHPSALRGVRTLLGEPGS